MVTIIAIDFAASEIEPIIEFLHGAKDELNKSVAVQNLFVDLNEETLYRPTSPQIKNESDDAHKTIPGMSS